MQPREESVKRVWKAWGGAPPELGGLGGPGGGDADETNPSEGMTEETAGSGSGRGHSQARGQKELGPSSSSKKPRVAAPHKQNLRGEGVGQAVCSGVPSVSQQ